MSALNIYIGLGSNLGDRAGHLLRAVRGMLDAGLPIARLSSIYETAPVDFLEQPHFLNAVAELAEVSRRFSPEQLLARLLRVEYALGRRRLSGVATRGPRTIDLDLLLYDDVQMDSEFLTLPHPRLHLRRFVLAPLAELVPDGQHPTLRQSFAQLLAATADDELTVRLWQP